MNDIEKQAAIARVIEIDKWLVWFDEKNALAGGHYFEERDLDKLRRLTEERARLTGTETPAEDVPRKEPQRCRYDWDDVFARAIVIIQADPSKLGMNCARWARELSIPRTTLAGSDAWKRIEGLQIADKNRQR